MKLETESKDSNNLIQGSTAWPWKESQKQLRKNGYNGLRNTRKQWTDNGSLDKKPLQRLFLTRMEAVKSERKTFMRVKTSKASQLCHRRERIQKKEFEKNTQVPVSRSRHWENENVETTTGPGIVAALRFIFQITGMAEWQNKIPSGPGMFRISLYGFARNCDWSRVPDKHPRIGLRETLRHSGAGVIEKTVNFVNNNGNNSGSVQV